jgi:hypothetical protein
MSGTGYGSQSFGSQGYSSRGISSPMYGSQGGFGGGSQGSMRSRKGPRGYQRSDERLREEVIDRLLGQSDIDIENIEVKVENGRVALSGTVDSRHSKHHIEDMVDSVWGVKDIENGLRVGDSRGGSSGSSGSSGRSSESDASSEGGSRSPSGTTMRSEPFSTSGSTAGSGSAGKSR